MKSKYTQMLSFREANIFLKILTLWICLVPVLPVWANQVLLAQTWNRIRTGSDWPFPFHWEGGMNAKAYNSSLYVGSRSAEYCFQTLSNTKMLRYLATIAPKPRDCNSFPCGKTSYQYLGRQHLSSSPFPVPSQHKAHLLRSFKTHAPAINSVWLLLYLHAKLHCSLPGAGRVFRQCGTERSLALQLGTNIWP